ncbi:MAG: type IV pilus modification protein PilV [Betaproteobacteria bacterium]
MHQKGMTLIEVMIAVFILASGLLGLGAVQARALQFNDSAIKRSIAADLATDLAERIRANRSPFRADLGASPLPPFPPDFSLCSLANNLVTCTSQPRSIPYRETYKLGEEQNEMQTWYATLSNQLPGATYTLAKAEGSAYPYALKYTLTITWLDDRGTNTNGSYTTVIE